MPEYTPLGRFRKFISRVSELATRFGDDMQLRGFKAGGVSGQVPVKTNGTDFNWSWGTAPQQNLTGVVTSVGTLTSMADGALTIAKTTGLQTTLNLKAPIESPTFTGNVTVSGVGILKSSRLNLAGIPTSAAGLVTGDVWSNAGVLTIV